MRYPQIVVVDEPGALAAELRPLVARQRWLLKHLRQPRAALTSVAEPRPTVVVLSVDPFEDRLATLMIVPTLVASVPQPAVIVVSRVKLSDDLRPSWTAAVLDLGADFVLFPPVDRSILEEVVSGLMKATIRRSTFDPASVPSAPIDLADGSFDES